MTNQAKSTVYTDTIDLSTMISTNIPALDLAKEMTNEDPTPKPMIRSQSLSNMILRPKKQTTPKQDDAFLYEPIMKGKSNYVISLINTNTILHPNHQLNYALDRGAALSKKQEACERPPISMTYEHQNVVIECSTTSFAKIVGLIHAYYKEAEKRTEIKSNIDTSGVSVHDVLTVFDVGLPGKRTKETVKNMKSFSCFGWTAVSEHYLDELHHCKQLLADYKPAYEDAEEKRRDVTSMLMQKIKLLQTTNRIRSLQDENIDRFKKDKIMLENIIQDKEDHLKETHSQIDLQNETITTAKQKITDLGNNLQQKDTQMAQLKEQSATKERLITKLNFQVEKVQNNLYESKHQVQLHKAKLIQQEEVIQQLNAKIELLENVIEDKNNDLLGKQELINRKSEECDQAVEEKEYLEDKLNEKILELIENDKELSKQVFSFINLDITNKKLENALTGKELELMAMKTENEKIKILVEEKERQLMERSEQLGQRIALFGNFATERSEIDRVLTAKQQDIIRFSKYLDDLSMYVKDLDIISKIPEDIHLAQDMPRSEVMKEKQIGDHMLPIQTSGPFITYGRTNKLSTSNSGSLNSLPDGRKNDANFSLLRSTSWPYIARWKKNSSNNNSHNSIDSVTVRKHNSGDQ